MNAQPPISPADFGLRRLSFEDFELRLDSGELFQGGLPVKLQPQPAKVLEVLASRSGEVVSREEIRQLVWGDAFIDIDASLNFCIKEIRRALGDSATLPRFIETVPRRGYRFLMPVRTAEDSRELAPQTLPPPTLPPVLPSPRPRRWSGLGTAGMAVGLLILLTFLLGSRLHPDRPLAGGRTARQAKPSGIANEAYLRGIYHLDHGEYEKAETRFNEVILLDPRFAPAYAKLAWAQLKQPNPPDSKIPETAIHRALELDPNLAEAHDLLGLLRFYHLDWKGAQQEIQTALDLDPENARAHLHHSLYLQALGYYAEAIAAVQKARDLDPSSMIPGSNYAWYLYHDHRYEEAIRQAQLVLDLYPPDAAAKPEEAKVGIRVCQDTILTSAWKLGDRETALRAAKALLEVLELPQEAAKIQNMDEFWRGREQRIQRMLRTTAADPFTSAKNAMVMGERERALNLLSRCTPEGVLAYPFTAVEPVFDELRSDPRWTKILDDCLKLPADAPARQG